MASLLLASGSLQLVAAFTFGTQIPNVPYPRIALSTHLNQIQEGLLAIAAGLISRDLKLSAWQTNIITGAHLGIWAFDLMSVCNCWWGTNRTLKMVIPLWGRANYKLAKEAAAPGGKDWQETIVGIVAIVFPLALIPAWGIIAYKLLW